MMIVLMIISILLLVSIPNMTKNNDVASEKGCEATIKLLQTQVQAYEIEHNQKVSSLEELKASNYVERITCPNNEALDLVNGVVMKRE